MMVFDFQNKISSTQVKITVLWDVTLFR